MHESFGDCTRTIEIFAAASSGCIELSRSIGLPLACVRASNDAQSALDAMNEASHAGAALWHDGFQPFEPQRGWRDWRFVPFGFDDVASDGMRLLEGRLRLDLPAHVPIAGFEASLHAELARIGLAAVTTSPSWLIARSDAGKPLLVPARYTMSDENDFRAGAVRVDDIFALDPSSHSALVARLAARARDNVAFLFQEDAHDAG